MASNNSYSQTALINNPTSPQQAGAAANLTFDVGNDNLEYNLDFGSPHVDSDFVWGAPPIDEMDLLATGTSNNYSPIGTVSMGIKVLGAAITLGTFPQAQRVASTTFISNSGLLSVDLIVAFNNQSNDGELGVFIAKDNGPVMSLATSSDVFDGLLAPNGFFAKRSGASYSLDIAPLIKQGWGIALYVVAYGTNKNTSNLTVSTIIRYINLDG